MVELPFAEQISSLPCFAQTLLACRFIRRVSLSLLEGDERTNAIRLCASWEAISRDGLRSNEIDGDNPWTHAQSHVWSQATVSEAIRYVVSAIDAATSERIESTMDRVRYLAVLSISAVYHDTRISRTQFSILLASDLDQIGFACKEAKIGR
jgi:hypothetical protein